MYVTSIVNTQNCIIINTSNDSSLMFHKESCEYVNWINRTGSIDIFDESNHKLISDILVDFLNPKLKYPDENYEIDHNTGCVKWRGKIFPNELISYLKKAVRRPDNLDSLTKFMIKIEQLKNNYRLMNFLFRNKFPITQNGNFLALKSVRYDFTSYHDKRTLNILGTYTSVLNYNSNRDKICGAGLHVRSHNYEFHNDKQVIIVEVDPRDIIALGDDDKMRVTSHFNLCQYQNTRGVVNPDSLEKMSSLFSKGEQIDI